MAGSRDPIFSSKTGEQIGYVEGAGAFDLKHRKRFDVDGNKNLIDPETKKIAGHLGDGGGFTGAGEVQELLFE